MAAVVGAAAASGSSSGLSAGGAAALSSGISAGAGLLSGWTSGRVTKKAQKRAFEYQKQLMALQAQQDRDQSVWNYLNSAMLQKKGLKAAGISTALMNEGQAFSGSMSSVSPPAAPALNASPEMSAAVQQAGQGVAQFPLLKAQIRQANAEADIQESEARYRDWLLSNQAKHGDIDVSRARVELRKAQQLLPVEVEQAKASLANTLESTKLTSEQINKVRKDIDHVSALITSVRIDNKWKPILNEQRRQKYVQEVAGLMKDNRIKEAQAKLADMGLFVGADALTNFMSVTLAGHSGQVLQALSSAVHQIFDSLPNFVGSVFSDLFDQFAQYSSSGAFGNYLKAIKHIWNLHK